jgi:hypothetical protein
MVALGIGGVMDPNDIHELVNQLKTELEAGRVKLNSPALIDSLRRVRTGPDGRVDPKSVSEDVRAFARVVAAAKDLKERKQLSLREIQAAYFESLTEMFGPLFDEMKRWNVTPQIIAEDFVSKEQAVAAFVKDLPAFASFIHEFWEEHGAGVEQQIRKLDCLKSVFGGDLFPSYTANIACSVGLYIETIILPDPLLRILDLFKAMPPKDLLKYMVKHALNALQYRELALADVEPPIVVIAPDFRSQDPAYRNALTLSGETDLLQHAGKIFGREFSSPDAVMKFLNEHPEPTDLFNQAVDPTRILFDTEWSGSLAVQFERYRNEFQSYVSPKPTVPQSMYGSLFGRMGQANDTLFRSIRYAGTPLVDAPTSWQYLLWKYEYDGSHLGVSDSELKNLLVSKAIQVEGRDELGMLSGVPPETLIQLRRDGAFTGLRETLGKGIEKIDSASASTLHDVANMVVENVDAAFSAHDKELKELSSSKRKFYGFDVGRWVMVGGLSVAAAAAESSGLGILAAASAAALGSPAIPDLKKRWEELRNTKQKLQRSPTALLFRHLKGKFGF